MTTLKSVLSRRMVLCGIFSVMINGVCLSVSSAQAQIASTPNIATTANQHALASTPLSSITKKPFDANIVTPAQSKAAIESIVHDDAFSKKIETTKWEEINPKPQDNKAPPSWWQTFWQWVFEQLGGDDNNGMNAGAMLAGVVKLALLFALLGFAIWLFKHRDTWLDWFRKVGRQSAEVKSADVGPHVALQYAPIWQGLPERHDLVGAIHQALSNQAWLLALSYLYRGTLREILQIHELPITRATTEAQCSWLLNQAPTRQADEGQYFAALVAIWSQVAYGQKNPTAAEQPALEQTLRQLTQDWQRLYLNAPKRRPPVPPTAAKRRLGRVSP